MVPGLSAGKPGRRGKMFCNLEVESPDRERRMGFSAPPFGEGCPRGHGAPATLFCAPEGGGKVVPGLPAGKIRDMGKNAPRPHAAGIIRIPCFAGLKQ